MGIDYQAFDRCKSCHPSDITKMMIWLEEFHKKSNTDNLK